MHGFIMIFFYLLKSLTGLNRTRKHEFTSSFDILSSALITHNFVGLLCTRYNQTKQTKIIPELEIRMHLNNSWRHFKRKLKGFFIRLNLKLSNNNASKRKPEQPLEKTNLNNLKKSSVFSFLQFGLFCQFPWNLLKPFCVSSNWKKTIWWDF